MTSTHSGSPAADGSITLSLTSHTNVGKTTLARTLLRNAVGIVADQPDTTQVSTRYPMLEHGNTVLRLWDSPGFTDTEALLEESQVVGGILDFLLKSWDQIKHKLLHLNQQTLRTVRDEADVVLYLVNATQRPGAATYLDREMKILRWFGKPVLVLLNKIGVTSAEDQKKVVKLWREHFDNGFTDVVKDVVHMDAHFSCWKHEEQLLERLKLLLPDSKKAAFEGLKTKWGELSHDVFENSMDALGECLANGACDCEDRKPISLLSARTHFVKELKEHADDAKKRLSAKWQNHSLTAFKRLIDLHRLQGDELAASAPDSIKVLQELPNGFRVALTTIAGGALTAACWGVIADWAAGGSTLGGGTLAGLLTGGAASYVLAKYALFRGSDGRLHWLPEHFHEQCERALSLYLAVSHFGFGRGEWKHDKPPEFWSDSVKSIVASNAKKLRKFSHSCSRKDTDLDERKKEMQRIMRELGAALMEKLYPKA